MIISRRWLLLAGGSVIGTPAGIFDPSFDWPLSSCISGSSTGVDGSVSGEGVGVGVGVGFS